MLRAPPLFPVGGIFVVKPVSSSLVKLISRFAVRVGADIWSKVMNQVRPDFYSVSYLAANVHVSVPPCLL